MSSAATYPVSTIAKLLMLTERRVQQLTADGVIPKPERGRYELEVDGKLAVIEYRDAGGQIVGVVGVIGPTRLNYARIVPMVDFTAQALSRLMK